MKRIIIFVIVYFTIYCIQAQRDFRKGVVITTNNKVLKGLIDYKTGSNKYNYCDFKTTKEDLVVRYTPDQIKSYGFIDDAEFISKRILDKNYFLEMLVKGKSTLYKYKNSFFIEKINRLYELKDDKILVKLEDKEYTKRLNRYKGSLIFLFSDCPQLKDQINRLNYTEKSLVKLTEKYNVCNDDSSITYKKSRSWFKILPGIGFGFNSSSINIDLDIPKYENYITEEFSREQRIVPSIDFDLFSPRINERIALHVGFIYLKNKYSSFGVIKPQNTSITDRNLINLDLTQVSVPIGVRYFFLNRQITPYISLGVVNRINLESKYTWIRERENNNIVEIKETNPLVFGKIMVGYWGSIGVKKNIFKHFASFVEIRYEFLNGILDNNNTSASIFNISSFQLFLGINI